MPSEMREYVVTQSQALIQATYAMTVMEQRLLLACISQVDSRSPMPADNTYTLTVEQARDLFYTDANAMNVYRDMARAVEKLYERDVKIQLPDNETLQTRFISAVVWSPDKYQITLTFASKIRPYLSELRSNFAGYKLKNIVQLTSSYAIRLYEKLVGWATQGQYYKEMEIAEFREMLAIGDKYNQIGQLKARVIEPAAQQINANTDFTLDVSFKKCKREVRWIQLRFNQKAEAKKIESEARAKRKAVSQRNQVAAQNRLADERKAAEKQISEWALAEAKENWEMTPVGVEFIRMSDKSEWVKDDAGNLYSEKLRASIPVPHLYEPLARGEILEKVDCSVPPFNDGKEWLKGPTVEFSPEEQRIISMYSQGLITQSQFIELLAELKTFEPKSK